MITAATILADGDTLGAGFIAFVVVVALGVASALLFRSMNRHLKGLPARFVPPAPDDEVPPVTPVTDVPENTTGIAGEHEG
jgi:hypothetical protein